MCIIVVKEKGKEFPTWHTLEQCFDNNSDGAGFMYNKDGEVYIKKGFMTFSEFKKALRVAKRKMDDNTSVVMHFRIKTHGETSRECCHPFPVEGKLDCLRMTEFKSEFGVAHNGIITGRDTNAKKSDTMDYILNVLYPLRKLGGNTWHMDKYVSALIEDTLGASRLAILDKNGSVFYWGDWFADDNGIYYSNTSYKEPRWTATNYAAYGAYSRNTYYDDPYDYGYNYYTAHNASITKYDSAGWEDDYAVSKDMMAKMPSVLCDSLCGDYEKCVMCGKWHCSNKDEAWDLIKLDYKFDDSDRPMFEEEV